jgi:2-C-methyl-D-erythritol 2,4-cyclodiphosphate synthase
MTYRIGYGEDAHRLEPGLPLVIGGLLVEGSPHGAVAHSDGDVLLHALADALLAAVALGDIGDYFPPTDPQFEGMDSADILRGVLTTLHERHQHAKIVNVALVVTLDRPKLGPQRQPIQERVAALLGLTPQQVGLGFKTSEGLAPEHVQARATVLLSCP